jgi:hypothetical protein
MVQDAYFDGYVGLMTNWNAGVGAKLRARFVPNSGASPDTALNAEAGGPFIPENSGGPWYERAIGGNSRGAVMPDGVLSEKNTAPAYANDNFSQHKGTVQMWLKPAFEPERAGKVRVFFNLMTYDLSGSPWTGLINLRSWIMDGFGMAYHPNHSGEEAVNGEMYRGDRAGGFQARSIVAGYAGPFHRSNAEMMWIGQPERRDEPIAVQCTATLNHVGHGHSSINYLGQDWGNFLMRGRWIHLGMVWDDSSGLVWDGSAAMGVPGTVWLYVNGNKVERPAGGQSQRVGEQGNTHPVINVLWGPESTLPTSTNDRAYGLPPDFGDAAKWKGGKPQPSDVPIRLGAESVTPEASPYTKNRSPALNFAGARYPMNVPADSTIDEFLVWKGTLESGKISDVWTEGRFYKSYGTPDKGSGGTPTLARFTSARIKFPASVVRLLPPKDTATPPGSGTTAGSSTTTTTTAPSVRLGLVAYNLRTPRYDQLGLVYASGGSPPSPKVYFDVLDGDTQSSLLTGTTVLGSTAGTSSFLLGGGAVTDDGLATGKAIDVDITKTVRYRFWLDSGFATSGARLNDPYTASPIVDDVIVTWYPQQPAVLSWVSR